MGTRMFSKVMLTGHAYVLQGGGGDDTFKGKHIVHEFMSKTLVRSSEKLPTVSVLV